MRLSPDDKSYAVKEGAKAARYRARQNVVAELFYFVGKLGWDRVLPLIRGELEIQYDYAGVIYKPYDSAEGKWRFDLAKELKACGYDVDANKFI